MKRSSCLLGIMMVMPLLAQASPKLIYAVDIIRHGMRSPLRPLEGDRVTWPAAPGMLLPRGMRQVWQDGVRARKRLVGGGLLPAAYARNSRLPALIHIESSDLSRTIMSAQSFLYGLYPLGTGAWQHHQPVLPLGFMPIPVHSRPRSRDDLLLAFIPVRARRIREMSAPNARMMQSIQNGIRACPAWEKAAGYPIQSITGFLRLADALALRKIAGVPEPTRISTACLQRAAFLYMRYWARVYKNHRDAVMAVAPIIRRIKAT